MTSLNHKVAKAGEFVNTGTQSVRWLDVWTMINLRLQKLLDSFLDRIIDREAYVAEKAKGMSQKKSLEEQSNALLKGRADWLEPFQNWITTARNAGEIAVSALVSGMRG